MSKTNCVINDKFTGVVKKCDRKLDNLTSSLNAHVRARHKKYEKATYVHLLCVPEKVLEISAHSVPRENILQKQQDFNVQNV